MAPHVKQDGGLLTLPSAGTSSRCGQGSRMRVPLVRLVWVAAAVYTATCLVLDITQSWGGSAVHARHRFKLERLPLTVEEKVQVVEFNRRAQRVREVCRAWGAYTSKKNFLRAAPRHSTVATGDQDVTVDREHLTVKEMENIWRISKKSHLQQLVMDDKHLITWCKVPKAASTSWVSLFMRMSEESVSVGGREGISPEGQHAVLRQLYPQQRNADARKVLPYHFKFMVTRHPFERLLSAYRDKLENYERDLQNRGGYYNAIYGKRIVHTYRSTDDRNTRREPTFREFVRYLLDTDVEMYDSHWQPIFLLCSPCHIRYDVITNMDTLALDSNFVLHHRGLDSLGGIEWTHKTDTSTKTNEVAAKYYTQLLPSEVRKLYHKYLMDFLLFEYDPTPYYKIVDAASGLDSSSDTANKDGDEDENEADDEDAVEHDRDTDATFNEVEEDPR